MCWIFAYNWEKNAIPFLINGLRNLEYRWYDSAWIIAISKNNEIIYEREVGRVSNLANALSGKKIEENKYTSWIAHTRWATHGWVTKENCHPHHSQNGRFFVVHNWIIENYKELKKMLSPKYTFYSDTDTEIIVNLIEEEFETDLKTTLSKIIKIMVGAYAIVVIDREHPDMLIGAKLGSPMLVGKWNDGIFIASDLNALSWIADNVTYIDDYEIVVIQNNSFEIYSAGEKIKKQAEDNSNSTIVSDIWSFSCFTEKEIWDIPEVINNVFHGRINFEEKKIVNDTLLKLRDLEIERVEIIASGSSYFAGYIGAYYLKELANIPTQMIISSEFLCDNFIMDKKTLYVFLSQSWETADVRESLKIVKEKGGLTFGIVNAVGSTIARLADMWLYSHAGVEIWVASTKNVIAQIGILLMMALSFWTKRNLQHTSYRSIIDELESLDNSINHILIWHKNIEKIAKKYAHFKNFFFLWRNILYPVASECSLKVKELSYIHSESYSTGELKHGPLALVWPDFPCVVMNPENRFSHKTISNIREIRARNGRVLWIITAWSHDPELYDDVIEIPKVSELLSPFLIFPAMYLFSFYLAKELWRDIDKPQNLAKSVTVE